MSSRVLAAAAQINDRENTRLLFCNDLDWLVVFDGEHGAQRLVTHHDRVDGGFKRGCVERSGYPHSRRNVVEGAVWLQLGEKPKPPLGEGQWQRLISRNGLQSRLLF